MDKLNEHVLYIWSNGNVKTFFAETELNPRQPNMKFFSIVVRTKPDLYELVYGTIDLVRGKWTYNKWNTIPDMSKERVIQYYTGVVSKLKIREYELD